MGEGMGAQGTEERKRQKCIRGYRAKRANNTHLGPDLLGYQDMPAPEAAPPVRHLVSVHQRH
jgi:hypothetical protein